MKFQGIIPPVITPYDDNLNVDYDAFAELVEHLVDAEVDSIIVGGTTGEYFTQSVSERMELIEVARDVIRGRKPLIVGVGAIRTEDCVLFATEARLKGADGILVSSPFYACPTEEENAQHALKINEAANLPIILYNYPGRTGAMMGTDFLDTISRYENFSAIKESSGDINQLHTLACDYPNLTLLCGADDQALEFFAWGAEGWVCGAGTALPEEHRALYETCIVQNDIQTGRKIMSAMLPYLEFLEQGGKFIQSVKFTCKMSGLPAGRMRPPLQELSESEQDALSSIVHLLKDEIRSILENKSNDPITEAA